MAYKNKEKWARYQATHMESLRAHGKRYRETHREILNERARRYRAEHPDRVRASLRKYHAKNQVYQHGRYMAEKHFVLLAYGGKCVCCGEPTECFLTIDHVNNDGHTHRLTGIRIYRWLRKQGCPKGQFQVLCWNCNCAKTHSQAEHEQIHPNAKHINGNRPALFF